MREILIAKQKPDGGETPHGLVYLAALLVKYSFVSLADLLPFASDHSARVVAGADVVE